MDFQKTTIASLISLLISLNAGASAVRDDIDYQYFRDFAENKGQFSVNASNIDIYNKDKQYIGTMLKDTPMIDFSAADRNSAVSVAISPQHITSVAHNVGYGSVSFGMPGTNEDGHYFNYLIVDRNNYPEGQELDKDYHIPRVHKLITEIVPMTYSTLGLDVSVYKDKSRFTEFVRVGSGTQVIRDRKNNVQTLAQAYQYLTGGAALPVLANRNNWLDVQGNLYDNAHSPMATYGLPGDSGSSVFTYDKLEKRWILVGVLNFYTGMTGNKNIYTLMRPDYVSKIFAEDEGIKISNRTHNEKYVWRKGDGQSVLTNSNGENFTLALQDESLVSKDTSKERPSLNAGKNLDLSGYRATIELADDINQGAGALYFNAGVIVRPKADQTWQGAGVSVAKGKRVDWQVKNPEGDRLSKIGEGILYVNSVGKNLGDISVGDGTVVLAQRADKDGNKQAFNTVGIVSGRPTVILSSADQVDPNNIYFGYRGGRLNVNGTSLTFNHIQNVDEGAKIVNHHASQESNITIHNKSFTEADLSWGKWKEKAKDIYEYVNSRAYNRKDYFALTGNPAAYFPTNQQSSANWEYLGSGEEGKRKAIETMLARKHDTYAKNTFNGYFGETQQGQPNGKLNVTYAPKIKNATLMLNGGLALNGNVSVDNGNLLLSGKPTPHAYDVLNRKDVVVEDDWINRTFNATNMAVNQSGILTVGRNVTTVNANFSGTNQGVLNLGFIQNISSSCLYSEYTGTTSCQPQAVISEQSFAKLPTTQISGNVNLADNAALNLGKATLTGNIQATENSQVALHNASHWVNTADSKVGHLSLAQGSMVSLNQQYASQSLNDLTTFNTLTIDGNLTGTGVFNYLTNAAKGIGDRVVVNGYAEGDLLLNVKNTGAEPQTTSPVSLLKLNNAQQAAHSVKVALNGGYVDLGAYRYILANQKNDYRLYSPVLAAKESNSTAHNKATEEINQAVVAFEALNAKLANLETEAQNRVTAQLNAKSKLTIAEQAVKTATQAVQAATKKVNESSWWNRWSASLSLLAARQQLQSAQANLDSANAAVNSEEQALLKARDALAVAKTEVANAQVNLANLRGVNDTLAQRAMKLCLTNQSREVCESTLSEAEIANSGFEDFVAKSLYADEISKAANEAELAYQQALAAVEAAQQTQNATAIAQAQEQAEVARQTAGLLNKEVEEARIAEANALLALDVPLSEQELDELLEQANLSASAVNNVKQKHAISRYSNAAISEVSAQVNQLLELGHNIDRELLTNKTNDLDVWANTEYQHTKHGSDKYRDYKQSTTLTQVGVEKAVNESFRVGALLSNSLAHNDFADNMTGKGKTLAATIFAKARANNGLFAVVDASYMRSKNEVGLAEDKTKFNRDILAFGTSIGKEWEIAGLKVQPSLGARYYRLSGTTYQLDGAQTQIKPLNFMSYHAGVKAEKTFNFDRFSLKPSLASYYVDASSQKLEVKVNNHTLDQQFGRHFRHELGMAAMFGKQWSLTANLGLVHGNEITKQKYAGLKVSYNW
ncbi:S6 family peptidase [Actinobacillus vicugnae]|uniref:S6 family peptidase n=1 Tax=Actinobacillus vicugnae TaxID=2573093 RepID=UPI00123F209F|nr:S6 family peptidase [Actinobacillus vicugnae]